MRWRATIRRSNDLTGVEQSVFQRDVEADTETEARDRVSIQVADLIQEAAERLKRFGNSPAQVVKCVEAEKIEIVSVLPAPETSADFLDTRVVVINGERMEVDVPKLLEIARLDDTGENRDLVVALLEAEISGKVEGVAGDGQVSHTHKHKCVGCRQLFDHKGKRKKCKLRRGAWCAKCQS